MNKLIRIGEAAELFGVHTETLRRWDKAGYLKAYRVGNRKDRRYNRKELILFIEASKTKVK